MVELIFQTNGSLMHLSVLTLSSLYTHFNTLKKSAIGKKLRKKVKLLKMSNFTFIHNVFYAICISKSFNSKISVVICSFFEFETVSKWYIREWGNTSAGHSRLVLCNKEQLLSRRYCVYSLPLVIALVSFFLRKFQKALP